MLNGLLHLGQTLLLPLPISLASPLLPSRPLASFPVSPAQVAPFVVLPFHPHASITLSSYFNSAPAPTHLNMPSILSKSSLLFLLVNLLRVLSIIGICLALSGEIVLMVSYVLFPLFSFPLADFLAGTLKVSSPTPPRSPPLPTPSRRPSLPPPFPGRSLLEAQGWDVAKCSDPTAPPRRGRSLRLWRPPLQRQTRLLLRQRSGARPIAARTLATPTSPTKSVERSSRRSSGSSAVRPPFLFLATSTDALRLVLAGILLLFALVSEMPPPSKYTQLFWAYAFPPLGEMFGVGVLGIMQVFIGCSILNHACVSPLLRFFEDRKLTLLSPSQRQRLPPRRSLVPLRPRLPQHALRTLSSPPSKSGTDFITGSRPGRKDQVPPVHLLHPRRPLRPSLPHPQRRSSRRRTLVVVLLVRCRVARGKLRGQEGDSD